MPDSPVTPGKATVSPPNVSDLLRVIYRPAAQPTAGWIPVAPAVEKLIVAVHGIGDQVRNDTILSTTVRFCDHFNYRGMVPLGAFYRSDPPPNRRARPEDPTFVIREPACDGLTGRIGFAEAHWADLARALSDDEHTLQETKAWARSIVQRIRVLAEQNNPGAPAVDHRRIRLVLEEMIDAIAVLESLLFLAAKAGVFEFNLRKILDAFLGDVQLVTEFQPVREQIVGRFHATIADAAQHHPDADIHVIAHSEGTVVSFLGLLEACSDPARHPWIDRVRGYMTLGSPIDKHLIFWPSLFADFKRPDPRTKARIRWLNYVDYGDPVGFNLDTARAWLKRRHYDGIFQFDDADDFSFRRYPVPGAAHVGYWSDPEVFDHFIRRVVDPPPAPSPREAKWLREGPGLVWWVPLVSHGVAYLLPLAAVHAGVFVLCKAVSNYLGPDAAERPNFIATFLGLSWLLAGTTLWLRVVRLARTWASFLLGAVLYGASAWAFVTLVSKPEAGVNELTWFEPLSEKLGWPPGMGMLALSGALIAAILIVDQARLLYRRIVAPARERSQRVWRRMRARRTGPADN